MIPILHCAIALVAEIPAADARPSAAVVAISLPPSSVAEPEEAVPLVYADLGPMLARVPEVPASEPTEAAPTIAYRPVDEVAPPPSPGDEVPPRR